MKPILIGLAALLFATAASAAPKPPAPQSSYAFGRASWYGREWTLGVKNRGTMANGQPFQPSRRTAASFAYPLGSIIEVTNRANGRRVVVPVTDRGPARRLGRLVDLSEAAADALGYHKEGVAVVAVRVVSLPSGKPTHDRAPLSLSASSR